MRRMLLVAAIALAAGCAQMKPDLDDYTKSSASYIGDRYTASLKEIVVPVEAFGSVKNMHIALTVAIETDKVLAGISDDVYQIIDHSESRIAAAVVAAASGNISMSSKMDEKYAAIAQSAQKAFDANFSKWKNARDYRVAILVTSVYLTDPRPEPERSPF